MCANKIEVLDEPLYYYDLREGSLSQSYKSGLDKKFTVLYTTLLEWIHEHNYTRVEKYASLPLLLDRSLLGRIKWKWMSSKRKLFKKKVEYFTKHNLNTSSTNNDKQYDIVIVGSDEVFKSQDSINLQLYGNIRQAKKKITYAASCGSAVIVGIPTETLPIIKRAMSNFSSMSVRDLGTEKYISALYDGKIYRNLDPVLVGTLYKRKHKPVPLKKYMIVYAYGTRIRKIEEIQAMNDLLDFSFDYAIYFEKFP